MTLASHHPDRPVARESPAPPTPAAHAALTELLRAAQRVEAAASGPDRRVAFRNTRSLIGAAYRLGFTFPAMALMLGTSESAARARKGWPWPMLPSAFRALIPSERLSSTGPLFADFGPEPTADLVEMLEHYLSVIDAQP